MKIAAEYLLAKGENTFSNERPVDRKGNAARVVVEGMGIVTFQPDPGQRVFEVVEMLRRVADALDP